jgi:hypothetical protein
VSTNILLNSESAEELQWLWDRGKWIYGDAGSIYPSNWRADLWRFYVRQHFTYVAVARDQIDNAVSAWPNDIPDAQLRVDFMGRENVVLKIEGH